VQRENDYISGMERVEISVYGRVDRQDVAWSEAAGKFEDFLITG
jgi:hypothetical protein